MNGHKKINTPFESMCEFQVIEARIFLKTAANELHVYMENREQQNLGASQFESSLYEGTQHSVAKSAGSFINSKRGVGQSESNQNSSVKFNKAVRRADTIAVAKLIPLHEHPTFEEQDEVKNSNEKQRAIDIQYS